MWRQRVAVYILIISLICCAMPNYVFAASSGEIKDISLAIDKNANHDVSSTQPNTSLEYPLTADMFLWSGSPGIAGEPVSRSQLRSANISVKYSSNQTKIIKDVTLSTMSYNGSETACVKLEFADELVSVNPMDFRLTIYLSIGNTRKEASAITINGTFENEVVEIDSSYNYVSLANGQVLKSKDYISEIEIDLGDGVQIFTRVQSDRKYYAKAKNALLDSDDAMISKNPKIVTAIHIKSVNLNPTGNYVSLRDVGEYHVYTSSGKYLGTTETRLPFYDLYYLTTERIAMNGAGTNDESESSGGAGSGAGVISGNTPEEKVAKDEMANAAKDAVASGTGSAEVSVKDKEKISTGELQAMFDAASLAQMKAKFIADTMSASGTAVQGRITINPAMAVKLNKDIMLGVYTSYSYTNPTKTFFEKYYTNKLKVVSLAQEGGYGMTVRIAARLSVSDMDQKNLYFYSYNKVLNHIVRIVNPSYSVDRNGYLHFNTVYGGYIVVSEGVLVKKKT